MISNSGRHIQITERRLCAKCKVFSDQVCHKVRYQEHSEQAGTYTKKSYWICPICFTEFEEVKDQPVPTDKVKIINRLLRMQEDYSIRSMNILSHPEKLVVEIKLSE